MEYNSFCIGPQTPMTSENLLDAKQECSQNPKCTMFYDSCGHGYGFFFCTKMSERDSSGCGSILHIKHTEGKRVQFY